jgi:mxaK protein
MSWPRPRLAWSLLALAVLAGGAEGVATWRQQQLAAQLSARPLPPPTREDPAALRLARALAGSDAGDDRALAALHALQDEEDVDVARAARYAAANLLLRQGLALQQRQQPGQAIALIEQAKQGYRALLRQTPQDWDARYNLERAQRLLPEPDEEEDEAAEGPRQAERAVTTMRSTAPGLP